MHSVPGGRQPGWRAVVPWIFGLGILLVIPVIVSSGTAFTVLNAIAIAVVFALSYNMLMGQTGLLSFGSAMFYGLGGYAAIHAMNAIGVASAAGEGLWAGFPVFALPLVGMLAGALTAFIIGWPCCRRGGVAFAMITLALGELVAAGAVMFPTAFGGESGIFSDRMVGVVLFGMELAQPRDMYWFMAFWLFVAALGMWGFTRTPLGRMANAVRDNAERLRFIGYPPQTVRFLAFIASGAFGGLAGGMAAVNYEIITPETLHLMTSGTVLLMAAIGGARAFYGPILGAILFTLMNSLLADYTPASVFYIGLVFLVVVMFAPDGLAGILEKILHVRRASGLRTSFGSGLASIAATLFMALGLVTLVEMIFQARHGRDAMAEQLGLDFSVSEPWVWIAILLFFALGYAARQLVRKLEEVEQ